MASGSLLLWTCYSLKTYCVQSRIHSSSLLMTICSLLKVMEWGTKQWSRHKENAQVFRSGILLTTATKQCAASSLPALALKSIQMPVAVVVAVVVAVYFKSLHRSLLFIGGREMNKWVVQALMCASNGPLGPCAYSKITRRHVKQFWLSQKEKWEAVEWEWV